VGIEIEGIKYKKLKSQIIIIIFYYSNIKMVKNTKGGSSHKKLARKNEELADKKINTEIDLLYSIIVIIDKNHGNAFTAQLLWESGINPDLKSLGGKDLKVMHQRGKKALQDFKKTQSKIAHVSIVSGITLTNNCIGYVEEFLEIDHLNAYLKEQIINREVYDKLSNLMTAKSEISKNEDDGGFIFDRTDGKGGEEEEVNIEDI